MPQGMNEENKSPHMVLAGTMNKVNIGRQVLCPDGRGLVTNYTVLGKGKIRVEVATLEYDSRSWWPLDKVHPARPDFDVSAEEFTALVMQLLTLTKSFETLRKDIAIISDGIETLRKHFLNAE